MAMVRKDERLQFGFAVFLMAFLGVLIGLSMTYGETSRLVPLIVAVPTFVAVTLVALSHVSETVDGFVGWFNSSAFTIASDVFDEGEIVYKNRPVARAIIWPVGLTIVAFLVGFVLVIPFFVYVFLRREGNHERRQSALIAIGSVVIISGLFEVFFGTALYVGYIPQLLINLFIS